MRLLTRESDPEGLGCLFPIELGYGGDHMLKVALEIRGELIKSQSHGSGRVVVGQTLQQVPDYQEKTKKDALGFPYNLTDQIRISRDAARKLFILIGRGRRGGRGRGGGGGS